MAEVLCGPLISLCQWPLLSPVTCQSTRESPVLASSLPQCCSEWPLVTELEAAGKSHRARRGYGSTIPGGPSSPSICCPEPVRTSYNCPGSVSAGEIGWRWVQRSGILSTAWTQQSSGLKNNQQPLLSSCRVPPGKASIFYITAVPKVDFLE